MGRNPGSATFFVIA